MEGRGPPLRSVASKTNQEPNRSQVRYNVHLHDPETDPFLFTLRTVSVGLGRRYSRVSVSVTSCCGSDRACNDVTCGREQTRFRSNAPPPRDAAMEPCTPLKNKCGFSMRYEGLGIPK